MRGHLVNLVVYALAASALLSLFWREGTRERARFALLLAGSMIGIALAAGWVMHFIGRP